MNAPQPRPGLRPDFRQDWTEGNQRLLVAEFARLKRAQGESIELEHEMFAPREDLADALPAKALDADAAVDHVWDFRRAF